MNSSQMEGDIDMDTIHPQKSNVMIECNREREDIGSSKRFKGSEEMNEKKLTYAEIIHGEEGECYKLSLCLQKLTIFMYNDIRES